MYDIVTCIGPYDSSLVPEFIENIKKHIINYNNIYIITTNEIVQQYLSSIGDVIFVNEVIFPFQKRDVLMSNITPGRSGWYLQQLLKIYAPLVLPGLLDDYLIIDSDVYFHKSVDFFAGGKMNFNVGTEYHIPYFEHMNKLHPSLKKIYTPSGITHLMPMKRKIVVSFLKFIEEYNNDVFWKLFLNNISEAHYGYDVNNSSGASEYEMLFTFTQQHFPEEYVISPLEWRNTSKIDNDYTGIYEACHYHMRS
jgi:hypothetical protein